MFDLNALAWFWLLTEWYVLATATALWCLAWWIVGKVSKWIW